jgi:hypothetical protein
VSHLRTLVDALPRRDVRSIVQAAACEAGVRLESARYSAPFNARANSSSASIVLEESDGPFVACALYTTAPLTTRAQVLINAQQLCAEPSEMVGLFEDTTEAGIGLVVPIAMQRGQYLDVNTNATLATTERVIADGFHLKGAGAEELCTALRCLGLPWVMRLSILGSGPDVNASKGAPDVCEVRRIVRVTGGAVAEARLMVGAAFFVPKGVTNTNDLGGATGASQASQCSFWLRRTEKLLLSQTDVSGVLTTTLLAVARRLPESAGYELPQWA